MASNKQRRDAELRKEMESEAQSSLFGDLVDSVPVDASIEVKERFSKAVKNHMMLLLMLKSDDFPLVAGQPLYVNISNPQTLDSMTLNPDGTLDTAIGKRESLDAAEAVYHAPNRKSTKSNGWTRIYVQNPNFSYTPLSELIVDHFELLGVPLDVVTDKFALANYLITESFIPEPYEKMIKNAAKKKAVVRKTAKLETDSSSRDGSGQ